MVVAYALCLPQFPEVRTPFCLIRRPDLCRTLRTLPGEIKQLKSELPKPDKEGNRPSSPLDGEIAALEDVRTLNTC